MRGRSGRSLAEIEGALARALHAQLAGARDPDALLAGLAEACAAAAARPAFPGGRPVLRAIGRMMDETAPRAAA